MFSVSPVSPPLFYEILESLTRDEKFSGHFLEEFLSKSVAVYCALGGGTSINFGYVCTVKGLITLTLFKDEGHKK